MKFFVLIFLTLGPILVQSTSNLKNIEKKTGLESTNKDLTQTPILKDDVHTKVKESKVEVPKFDKSNLGRSKDHRKDELKMKDESKLKDKLEIKDELKLKDELELKDDLKFKATDQKPVDRAKKACKTVPGPNTSPTKICFELTPGVQGPLEVCKEDMPTIANLPQIPQELQPIPQPQQTNVILEPDNQFSQPHYEIPNIPFFYKEPSLPAQVPMNWDIQTEKGQQNIPSIIEIQPQSPQESVYQPQTQQQFYYPQNLPSNYPPNVFPNYPPPIFPGYPTLPFVPPQTFPFSYSQNLPLNYPPYIFPNYPTFSFLPPQMIPLDYSQNFPSGYFPVCLPNYPPQAFPGYPPIIPFAPSQTFLSNGPQNLPTNRPQNFPSNRPQNFPTNRPQSFPSIYPQNIPPSVQPQPQPPQQSFSQAQSHEKFGHSQNEPPNNSQNFFSHFPQNIPINPQNTPINSQNTPNNFIPVFIDPSYNPKFEIVQPDSQGFLPTRAPVSPGNNILRPAGPAPTGEENNQKIQHSIQVNGGTNFDPRRLQPGPLSRILDRPSSFQMFGSTGTMENSWGPYLQVQGPRFTREPKVDQIQEENVLQSQSSQKSDQSIHESILPSSLSQIPPSLPLLKTIASQQSVQSISSPTGSIGIHKQNFQDRSSPLNQITGN